METVRDAQEIVDRLTAAEMQRVSVLQLDSDTLRREIHEAHTFAKQTTYACDNCTPEALAGVYDSLLGSCRRLADKPFKTEITVTEEPFARETYVRKQLAEKAMAMESQLGGQEQEAEAQERAVASMRGDLEEQRALVLSQQAEMQEWVSCCNRYHSELRKFLMRCDQCGEILSPENINLDCPGIPAGIGRQDERWGRAQQNRMPTGRHHFVPIDDGMS